MEYKAVMNGANFRPASAKEVLKTLTIGDQLTLERDPQNPYHSNAVKVIEPESGEFIGFVEKDVAEAIAPILDDGLEAQVKIIGFASTIKPHLSITFAD